MWPIVSQCIEALRCIESLEIIRHWNARYYIKSIVYEKKKSHIC